MIAFVLGVAYAYAGFFIPYHYDRKYRGAVNELIGDNRLRWVFITAAWPVTVPLAIARHAQRLGGLQP